MKLAEIATRTGCELRGNGDIDISGLSPIEDAEPGTLTFVANPRYHQYLATTRAAAVILAPSDPEVTLPSLRAADPYAAFAAAIPFFYAPVPQFAEGIHPTAVIDPSARLGADARVGPYAVIGAGCVLGARAHLDPHVVVYPGACIGDDFRAYAHAVIRENVRIGHRVIVHAGAVVGGDGFGYVIGADGVPRKIVQAGTVVLDDDVEVGENATVDRAAIGATRLARGVKIDNLVMVAHGCSIGEWSALAGQVGLSGSTKVGRGVRMGGQVGVGGHLSIGDGVQIAAQTGVHNDIEAGAIVGGSPAIDVRAWRRYVAAWPRLPDMLRRLRRLEKRLGLTAE